jgi:hypothetical protein
MFDPAVREMNRDSVIALRRRFADWLAEIVARHPGAAIDVDALADHLTVVVEGGIILSRALSDRSLMGRHLRLFREHVKAAFGVA